MLGGDLKRLMGRLKSRSEEMGALSKQLLAGSEQNLDLSLKFGNDAQSASASVEEISNNMSAISAAAEEFSVNMQHVQESARHSEDNIRVVSNATRELAQASSEIAQNTERARTVSHQAVSKVDATRSQVASLESVAAEISNVTQVIHDISEQTKVLALNATIEAAREAEAGRGFAVVAREVKDLASETRDATAFIRTKVNTIESAIGATIEAIQEVADVIAEVNHVVNNIAAAAEEQSITTQDIATNATSANERFEEMATAINEGSVAIQDVNRRIAQSALRANSAAKNTNEIASASQKLASDSTVEFARILEMYERIDEIITDFDDPRVKITAIKDDEDGGLFRFSPRFSVLVDDMDADHQRIFDYINEVHALVRDGGSTDRQAKILREMSTFTREHFAREEVMMKKHDYPGLPAQLEEHEKLLNRVDGLTTALDNGEEVNMISVMNFLNNWLKDHILTMDRQYGDYFKKKRIAV